MVQGIANLRQVVEAQRKQRQEQAQRNRGKEKLQQVIERSLSFLGSQHDQFVNDPSTFNTRLLLWDEEKYAQPNNLLRHTLRSYQIEGLKWLVNLYDTGGNGILAGIYNFGDNSDLR